MMMDAEIFSFNVGAIACTVIPDTRAQPTLESLADRFPAVDREQFLQALRKRHAGKEAVDWSMNCLLIQSAGQTLLVDSGQGPGSRPGTGHLADRLARIVREDEIDTVIVTHGHPDHIGGLITADGRPAFPEAKFVMRQAEWEHWMGPDGVAARDEQSAPFLHARLGPIESRLTLIDQEVEIALGVRIVSAPGHTPGHIGLLIDSEGEKLLDLVDCLHFEVQLDHPEWCPRFDVDPARAIQTRRELLGRAADEDIWTLLYHFGFPGLGRITRRGESFDWRPDIDG